MCTACKQTSPSPLCGLFAVYKIRGQLFNLPAKNHNKKLCILDLCCSTRPPKPHFVFSSVIITVELSSSRYGVREEDGNATVCIQTDIGLPEAVEVQLTAFELLEENNATGKPTTSNYARVSKR